MSRPRLLALLLLAGCRTGAEVRPEPAPLQAPGPSASSPAAQRLDRPAPSVEAPAPSASADPAAMASADAPAPSGSAAFKGPCVIRITEVLEAQSYRGPGDHSPSRQRVLDSLPPKERAQWHGRDHGLLHLRCRYAVSMNGKAYRYDHIAAQVVGFDSEHKLDPKRCETERGQVEKKLIETTERCSNPHAGAYWGYDLVEVGP